MKLTAEVVITEEAVKDIKAGHISKEQMRSWVRQEMVEASLRSFDEKFKDDESI